MRTNIRRAAWVVMGLTAVAGGIAGALGKFELSLLFLALALLALGGAVALSIQLIVQHLQASDDRGTKRLKSSEQRIQKRISTSAGDVAKSVNSAERSIRTEQTALRSVVMANLKPSEVTAATNPTIEWDTILRPLDRSTKTLSAALVATRKQIDHLPYLAAELTRRQAQLIDSDAPMPVLGANWAATAPTILFNVDEILGGSGRRVILECGSGASTLWEAAALRHRDEGHVYTLEHDTAFGEVTRQALRSHGLENWATVVDAPLVELDVPRLGRQPWYDLSQLGDLEDVDLLFVDGPPRPTAPLARFPAVPLLLPRLRDGALVVLDDTNRRAEKDIAKMWAEKGSFNRPLTIVKEVGRSTILRVG